MPLWDPFQPDGTPASKINFANLGTGAIQSVAIGEARLFALYAINNQASLAAYVQVFDALVANITLGTTVPDEQIIVAAGTVVALPLPRVGVLFSNGISVQSTTGISGGTGSAAGVYVYALYLSP